MSVIADNTSTEDNTQYQRRFQGTQNLYGAEGLMAFERAHVVVIGVGGVGSWAAEGLARTGVGHITLIDLDVLVASNVNRQLPALDSTFGQSKIEAMAQRIREINPHVTLNLVDDFLTPDNVSLLLPSREQQKQYQQQNRCVVILDCTDDMAAKLAIALHCRFNKLKLICAGGAGGKTDPLQVTVSDLKDSYQDPLLARMRSKLRHENNINTQMKEKFGIRCVYSTQPPITHTTLQKGNSIGVQCEQNAGQTGGLHCGGYGSAVAVTATVGMVMVSETLAMIGK